MDCQGFAVASLESKVLIAFFLPSFDENVEENTDDENQIKTPFSQHEPCVVHDDSLSLPES
jgi:hypothetical protein